MHEPMITALAGGVGGAKLVYGLAKALPPEKFSVIVNTGDDFTYLGLKVSPDIDSIVYSLAGVSDLNNGYGRADDSFTVIDTLTELGESGWFRIGDKDLALNIKRTNLLNSGCSLCEVTKILCKELGVHHRVIPMTNENVSTKVDTFEYGVLDFQDYFVKYRYEPSVNDILYSNIDKAKLSIEAKEAIEIADYIIICPSNPWLSIYPIINIPEVKDQLSRKKVIAVSPIIGNDAVKGPTAKLFNEFGIMPSAFGVAELYKPYLSVFVIDHKNSNEVESIKKMGIKPVVTDIMMSDEENKCRLAKEIIEMIGNFKI